MPKFINGPINYVKLVGQINNKPKNITIFMDVHLDINNQTRCSSFDSIDISQYLYTKIKNAKIPIDLFMEIRNDQIQKPTTNKKDIYIREVIELFKSEFVVVKDKVSYSKSNPNVRLHYLDIRDHLEIFYTSNLINNEIISKLSLLKGDNLTDAEKIDKIEQIKKHIELIKEYTENIYITKNIIQQNQPQHFDKKSQKYYLNKIIHEYQNENLQTKINEFFDMNVINNISEFQGIVMQIFQLVMYYKYDMKNIEHINRILSLTYTLNTNILKMYTTFTDAYFLRRFLDKDYIRNVITYCGRYHGLNYIYFLIKYFNFEITKIYNPNGLTINNIMDKIKKTYDLKEVYNLFLIKGEKSIQCTDYLTMEDIMYY